MDLTTARDDLSAAATTVPDVTCKPRYWQISNPGDALVRLDALARDDTGFGYLATWQVQVALSQDLAEAETWIDAHIDALTDALTDVMVVTLVQPVDLVLDTGRVPALLIQGTRAA